MPLPQRVTVEDPGATAVNLNAITSGVDEVTIEKPGPQQQQQLPQRKLAGAEMGSGSGPAAAAGDSGQAAPTFNVTHQGALAGAQEISGTVMTAKIIIRRPRQMKMPKRKNVKNRSSQITARHLVHRSTAAPFCGLVFGHRWLVLPQVWVWCCVCCWQWSRITSIP